MGDRYKTGYEYSLSWTENYTLLGEFTWVASKGPRNPLPLFMEESCNATCPDKCSSANWKILDDDRRWKTNHIINVDCAVSGLIPRPSDGCPEGTIGFNAPGCPNTCYCEDHCSWEKCSLVNAPTDCFHRTNGAWSRKSSRDVWVAKFHGTPNNATHTFFI